MDVQTNRMGKMKKGIVLIIVLLVLSGVWLYSGKSSRVEFARSSIEQLLLSLPSVTSYTQLDSLLAKELREIDSLSTAFLGSAIQKELAGSITDLKERNEIAHVGAKGEKDPLYTVLFLLHHPDTIYHNDSLSLWGALEQSRMLDSFTISIDSLALLDEFSPYIRDAVDRFGALPQKHQFGRMIREKVEKLAQRIGNDTYRRNMLDSTTFLRDNDRVRLLLQGTTGEDLERVVDSLTEALWLKEKVEDQYRLSSLLFSQHLKQKDTTRAVNLLDSLYNRDNTIHEIKQSGTDYLHKYYIRSMSEVKESSAILAYLKRWGISKEYQYVVVKSFIDEGQPKKAHKILMNQHILNRSGNGILEMVRYWCENKNITKASYYTDMLIDRQYRYGDYGYRSMALLAIASYYAEIAKQQIAVRFVDQALDIIMDNECETYHWQAEILGDAAILYARAVAFPEAFTIGKRVNSKEKTEITPFITVVDHFRKEHSFTATRSIVDSILEDTSTTQSMKWWKPEIYMGLCELYAKAGEQESAQILFSAAFLETSKEERDYSIKVRLVSLGKLFHRYQFEITPENKTFLSNVIQQYHPIEKGTCFSEVVE